MIPKTKKKTDLHPQHNYRRSSNLTTLGAQGFSHIRPQTALYNRTITVVKFQLSLYSKSLCNKVQHREMFSTKVQTHEK